MTWDLRTVDGALRAGLDPAEAALLGVFTIWSRSEEVLPLFGYARATHDGDDPLEMAGFDMQFWERRSTEHVFVDFRGLPARHSLRDSASLAIRGYRPEVMEDWTRVVDGMFFIDRMRPATRIER